ncbi:C40 family peptidase [Nocardia goodfellowii]|uniref:Cell wall-associated NlpC family hydrolase n=1 Tax=Nocardia goodfellowii TaxID=882446 RepID=A0ABS4Q8T6_9NOCA|nr:C40 family peptidase [Nocardia goodfellowii]MBP2187524.1 cell wall-associated NlpC family hydrolase [Nocardia goodfellowii]
MARHLWRFIVGGLLIAAGALGIMLYTAGTAAAQEVKIPGVGTIEIPNEIQIPAGVPGIEVRPQAPAAVAPGFEQPMTTAPLRIELESETLAAPAYDIPVGPFVVGPAEPETPAQSDDESMRLTALEAARSRLGADYNPGSNGPDSFDCSGLVQWSYEQAGVDLPRTSYEQAATGTPVPLDELEPGDVVTFYDGGHSALYAGDGEVIHASTSGRGVEISPMESMPVTGARRP